jgi:hypothetical protein
MMHKPQAVQTSAKPWLRRLPGASGGGHPERRQGAGRFTAARGRPATSSPRFPAVRPGGRQSARRGKQSLRTSAMALTRGVFGAASKSKASKPRKGSRRGPALVALLGGLGAAGAAAFKRRQSTRNQAPPPPGADTASQTPAAPS